MPESGARSVGQTPSTGLRHPSCGGTVPESEARSVGQTPSAGLPHHSSCRKGAGKRALSGLRHPFSKMEEDTGKRCQSESVGLW